jgi:uncharacterized membrane protein YjjP (DUF1212 family)
MKQSWLPSRKWLATQVTAIAALLIAWVNAGAWDKTLTIAMIGVAAQSIAAYLIPNADAKDPAPLVPSPVPAGR